MESRHMSRSERSQPGLEPLDGRVLLSQMPVLSGLAPVAPLVTTSPTLHLTGSFTGTYKTTDLHPIPDVGRTVNFTGMGAFNGQKATLSGNIHIGGFIAPPDPGQVTIMTSLGSLTLKVHGAPVPTAVTDKAIHLVATIVSGTGSYRNLSGTGTATLTLIPIPNLLQAGTQTGRMGFVVDLQAHRAGM
jgi:hypothetical protein